MVVLIFLAVVQKRRTRSLIVHIADSFGFLAFAAKHPYVRVFGRRRSQQSQKIRHRLDLGASVHRIALVPRTGVGQNIAAEEAGSMHNKAWLLIFRFFARVDHGAEAGRLCVDQVILSRTLAAMLTAAVKFEEPE